MKKVWQELSDVLKKTDDPTVVKAKAFFKKVEEKTTMVLEKIEQGLDELEKKLDENDPKEEEIVRSDEEMKQAIIQIQSKILEFFEKNEEKSAQFFGMSLNLKSPTKKLRGKLLQFLMENIPIFIVRPERSFIITDKYAYTVLNHKNDHKTIEHPENITDWPAQMTLFGAQNVNDLIHLKTCFWFMSQGKFYMVIPKANEPWILYSFKGDEELKVIYFDFIKKKMEKAGYAV
jgi:hypothetical protein